MTTERNLTLMHIIKWYLIPSCLFSISYCLVFIIIPYYNNYDFRDWLMETLGHSAGFYPDYTMEILNVLFWNFFPLFLLSIVLLKKRNWYAIIGFLACGVNVYCVLYWATVSL